MTLAQGSSGIVSLCLIFPAFLHLFGSFGVILAYMPVLAPDYLCRYLSV